MLALNERQQKFVNLILSQGLMNYTRAYMEAYGASYDVANANGTRLAHSPAVLDAMHEEASKRLKAGAALAVTVLTEIANDPTHKDRLRAATAIADRVGFHAKTEHEVTVKRPTDAGEVIQQIIDVGKQLGWSDDQIKNAIGHNAAVPMQLLAPVDAEFEVVSSTEGLEDLLG